jgi:hypothetical protein
VSGERNGTLTVKATGDGGLAQATAGFQDDQARGQEVRLRSTTHPLTPLVALLPACQVQYAWVRLIRADGGGDSKRVKFVLLCWTGERSGVLAKSRVTEHRAWLGQHFTPTHVTLSLSERAALDSLEGGSRAVGTLLSLFGSSVVSRPVAHLAASPTRVSLVCTCSGCRCCTPCCRWGGLRRGQRGRGGARGGHSWSEKRLRRLLQAKGRGDTAEGHPV